MIRRTAISLVLVLAGVVIWMVSYPETLQVSPTERTWTAQRQTQPGVVRERGRVVSNRTRPVQVLATGDIAELCETGTRVRKGDVVLRMDDGDVQDDLEEKQLSFKSLLVDIELAEAERELMRVKQANFIRLQQRKLEFARVEYADAVNGLDAQSRRLLQIRIALAELRLADARDELSRQRRLQGKGFASDSMVEPFERRVASAEAALAEAKLQLELEEKGAAAEELEELKRRVERYEASVARGEEALARKLAAADTKIAAHRAELARDNHTLSRVRDDCSNTVVRAGMDGVVRVRLYREWRSGGIWVPYRAGQWTRKHDRIADIVDLGEMAAELMVHEADVNRLTNGMPARVTLPAFPGRVFDGRLVELGGVGRDRFDVAPRGYEKGASGVTMFNARVAIDAAGVEFRPGMSAIVEFCVVPEPDGLLVPREYVSEAPDGLVVRKRREDGDRVVPVTGKLFDERYYAVSTGVTEGDVLVVREVGR